MHRSAVRFVAGLLVAVMTNTTLLSNVTVVSAATTSSTATAGVSVAPPRAVTVVNAGEGRATVTWQLPPYANTVIGASIDGFVIQKKLAGADDNTYTQAGVYYLPDGTPSDTISYTVTGFDEGTYDFRVLTLSKLVDADNAIIKSRTDCSGDTGDTFKCKALNIAITATTLPTSNSNSGGSGSGSSSSNTAATDATTPQTPTPPEEPVIPADTVAPTIISASTTAAAGEYSIGDVIPLTLTFSEAVTSANGMKVHLNSGATITIPAWNAPTTSVTVNYVVGAWETTSTLGVLVVEGSVRDAADNVTTNPVPASNITTNLAIRSVSLVINDPAPTNGQYVTTGEMINITPNASGATTMYIHINGLKASDARNTTSVGTWITYTGQAFSLALSSELGARMITIDFKNAAGVTRSASGIITRLGATPATAAETKVVTDNAATAQQTVVDTAQTVIGNTPVDLTTIPTTLLGSLTTAITTKDASTIANEKAKLTTVLDIIAHLRELLTAGRYDEIVVTIVEFLTEHTEYKLNQLLTTTEINQILAHVSADDREMLLRYLDRNTVALHTDADTQTTTIVESSLSIRDSDGDGLSDLVEMNTYHTNPYLTDTDGDGFNDAQEVLDLGTDPLDPRDPNGKILPTRFIGIENNQIIATATPVLRGTAPRGASVIVVAVNSNGAEITLGTTTADTEQKWLFVPTQNLIDGAYTFELRDATNAIADTRQITIDLAFVLPPPQIVATSAGDVTENAALVFDHNMPTFYGNTYYGSTVVASFQSVLMSTSIIADNPEGDFEIHPPKNLEPGDHTLTLYAELPDGTRSAPRVMKFSVDPSRAAALHQAAILRAIFSIRNLILLVLVINFGVLLYELWKDDRTRRPRRLVGV